MSTEVKTDEKKVGDAKPDPKKPIDRKRPFLRINNEQFVPSARPDGFGKACGCHTPDEFEDFEKEFLKFLETDAPLFKTLLDVLDAVKKIARAVSAAANIIQFTPLLPIAVVIKAIADVTDVVVTAIDTALRDFLAVLARRIFRRAVRVLPQWVPVKKDSPKAKITSDQVVEVEGVVTRSFGNPIDVPFRQWHQWFNWNVQIKPDDKYKNVRSPADDPPNQEGWAGAHSLFKADCFEIQLDAGALWNPGGEQADKLRNGLKKSEVKKGEIEDIDWPPKFIDFCWPSTDMSVWAAGRWVYDCSRTTSVKKDDKDKQPQMVAMINPCKAIATARFRAFKFIQNDFSVPAVQFMFFTNKRGGYLSYDTISDQDYEFILDLPPNDFKPAPFPIGASPKIPHNTIVVRPRLLHKIDKGIFEQFMGAVGAKKEERDKNLSPDPVITLIPSEKPGELPKQVKIKVPCTKLGNAEAYGFILTFGWHDPLLEQARKVKECTMKVSQFTGAIQLRDSGIKKIRAIFGQEEPKLRKKIAEEVANQVAKITVLGIPVLQVPLLGPFVKQLIQDMIDEALKGFLDILEKTITLESEEWLLRIGVNGRWERVYIHDVPSSEVNKDPRARLFKPKPLPHPIEISEFRLEEDEPFRISAHGMEFDPVGDMMWSSQSNRTLTLDDQPVDWATICDPSTDADQAKTTRRRLAMRYTIKLLTDSTSTAMALGLDNSPLGIIDPDEKKSGPFPISNPVELKTAEPGFPDGLQKALFARAVDIQPDDANQNQDQMILVEDSSKDDYEIFYTLDIKDQVPTKK
jgi:hypothetical protein